MPGCSGPVFGTARTQCCGRVSAGGGLAWRSIQPCGSMPVETPPRRLTCAPLVLRPCLKLHAAESMCTTCFAGGVTLACAPPRDPCRHAAFGRPVRGLGAPPAGVAAPIHGGRPQRHRPARIRQDGYHDLQLGPVWVELSSREGQACGSCKSAALGRQGQCSAAGAGRERGGAAPWAREGQCALG